MNGQLNQAGDGTNRLQAVNAPIPSAMDRAETLSEAIAAALEHLEKRLSPYLTSAAQDLNGAHAGAKASVEGASDFHHRLAEHGERLSRSRDRVNELLSRLTL